MQLFFFLGFFVVVVSFFFYFFFFSFGFCQAYPNFPFIVLLSSFAGCLLLVNSARAAGGSLFPVLLGLSGRGAQQFEILMLGFFISFTHSFLSLKVLLFLPFSCNE